MPGMEEFHTGSEGSFNSDEADNIVKECIDNVVGGDDYSQSQVNKWTASIVERCLTQLVKMGKPYKYIVTCAVMQKTGAGLHTANSCYWDTAMDDSESMRNSSESLRKLHREVGKPHHVLCGQRVCCGHRIETFMNRLTRSAVHSGGQQGASQGHSPHPYSCVHPATPQTAAQVPTAASFPAFRRMYQPHVCIYLVLPLQCFNNFTFMPNSSCKQHILFSFVSVSSVISIKSVREKRFFVPGAAG
uniref:Dynein light chain Tctex-type 3 n=1 Tax=Amphiprion ocellaris TaxID=80972 RepID=A0AAQ5ZN12_AMPOC